MAATKRIMNRIYNEVSDMTSHIYRDDDWRAVRFLCDKIRTTIAGISNDLTLFVSVPNGGYHSNNDGTQWKEYALSIEQAGKEIICGSLTAHAAGSVQDPFDRYDMTVVLWKA
jgi:hypothetical protein